MKISDVVSGMLRGRVAGAAAGVLGMVASLTAFEWTFNRHYVPDGCSLVLRYKGPPLPFLPGERPVSASGQFARVDDRGQPLEKGILKEMLGPGRHFLWYGWWETNLVKDTVVNPGEVAVVTSIGPEHLEGFGDLAGVAREEATLLAALPPGAPCFAGLHGLAGHAAAHGTTVPALVALLTAPATGRRLELLDDAVHPTGHGDAPTGRVASLSIRLDTPAGSAELPLPGAHNLSNATLAYRAAVAAGVAPQEALAGLSRAVPSAGRCQPKPWGHHRCPADG